jgi:hypothetical protein
VSTDYGEKERQFLETLKTDTGRDVAEWMAIIAAEKLTTRNEIIDWLRRKGFMFSKASWLERIHNNGGRPIYENGGAARKTARPRRAAAPGIVPAAAPSSPVAAPPAAAAAPPPAPAAPSATVIPLRVVRPAPPAFSGSAPPPTGTSPAPAPPALPGSAPPAFSGSAPPPSAQKHDLEAVLAKAKAFRPLANYVLSEIAKAIPASIATPGAAHIVLSKGPQTFAVLTISAKELRLGLVLAGAAVEAPYQATKAASFPADHGSSLTHMAVLNDARQINDALLARVLEAADRVG